MLLPQLGQKGQKVDDLIADLKQPVETQEVRFKLEREDFKALGRQVIADLKDYPVTGWSFNPENEEGIRFILSEPFGRGWFLLRLSLHEPLLVLQIENDLPNYMPAVLETLHTFLSNYPDVNQDKLLELLKK